MKNNFNERYKDIPEEKSDFFYIEKINQIIEFLRKENLDDDQIYEIIFNFFVKMSIFIASERHNIEYIKRTVCDCIESDWQTYLSDENS